MDEANVKTIRIRCPHCAKNLKVIKAHLGRIGRCPACGREFQFSIDPAGLHQLPPTPEIGPEHPHQIDERGEVQVPIIRTENRPRRGRRVLPRIPRVFLLAIVAIGLIASLVIVVAYFGTNRNDEAAVKKIESIGGGVKTDHEFFAIAIYFGSTEHPNSNLSLLRGLRRLEFLDLSQSDVTDAGLENIQGLRTLKSLNIYGTNVSDAGLVRLRGLKNLQELTLGSDITDNGLANIGSLTSLVHLKIYSREITDNGLLALRKLHQLKSLYLTSDKITHVGLQSLSEMPDLRQLELGRPREFNDAYVTALQKLKSLRYLRFVRQSLISDNSLNKLELALPNCEID